MAVTITLTADASTAEATLRQFQATITQSLAGINAKMQDTAQKTQQTTEAWRTSLTNLSQATVKLVAPQQELSKAFLQTGQAAQRQLTEFEKLRQQYLKTVDATKSATAGFGSLLTSFRGMAAALGVGLSISGLVDLTKSVVEAGLAQEKLMLTLRGATGSILAAGEAYQFVRGVANQLGTDLVTSVEGFAKLTAATKDTAIQGQQTRDLFVAMSQASRVMGLSTAEVGGVMTALTQIIGKNTVSMEELKQQLGERLPSALRLTAKEMGLTTSQMVDMVSKGQILATDFIPAVTRAFETMGKEAPSAAASATASLNRIGNAWFELKASIASSGVLDAISAIAEAAAGAVNAVNRAIRSTQQLQGSERVAQLQQNLITLSRQLQLTEQEAQKRIEGGMRPEAAMSAVENLRTKIKAVADEITGITGTLRDAALEEEQIAASLKAGGGRDATLKFLQDRKNTAADLKQSLADINRELTIIQGKDVELLRGAGLDPLERDFPQQQQARAAKLLKDRQDIQDQLLGIDRKAGAMAVREAGQSAVERAKAEEDALKTSLQRQETMIEASADTQRRAIDEAAAKAIVTQGPGVVEAEAAKRAQALQKIATETAEKLETLRLGELEKQTKAREVTLQAEIAAAGKNLSARAAAEQERTNLVDESEKQRAIITGKRADAEQKTSKQIADARIADAREVNKIIQEIEQDRLKGQINLVDEQIALIEAQVQGEVLTTEQGLAQIQALEQKRFADRRLLLEHQAQAEIDAVNVRVQATEAETDARVQAEKIAAGQIAQIRQGLAIEIKGLNFQQETQEQVHRNELLKGWREWARDVQQTIGSFLVDLFEGQIRSIQSLFDRLKSYFFRVIADMIAYAATHAIVVPIVSAVLGGGGGGTAGTAVAGVGLLSRLLGGTGGTGTGGTGGTGGGGLLETGGTALTGLGLAKSLYSMSGLDTLSGYVGTGLVTLKDTLLTGVDSIFSTTLAATNQAVAVNNALAADLAMGIDTAGLGASGTAGTTSQAAGALGGQIAGIAGGLAALGGGIYAALNASNNAAKAAYAASAAAGAFAAATAAYGAVTGAAVVTAAGTGWTGIGLIVAAVMAVIGVVLDRVIKPEGPSLSVGRPSGLNITRQGDRLGVEGDLGTRVTRREGPSPEFANAVQAQMEEGITSAVQAMVQSINAIALDPVALLEPTQEALQAALRNLQTLNTANADKMTTDITEQLRFINIAIVGGLLEPVNKAFDQLRDRGTLTQQLERLPGTVSGMVSIFKNLNEQLDQINKGENTDVLRQVSGVRNQIENFGNRIAGTAGSIAESIVTGIMEVFKAQVDTTLAGQITQFAGMMNTSIRALGLLRQTRQTIEGAGLPGGMVASQIDRLVHEVGMTSARISTGIVTTALRGLSADLQTVLVQPLRVQATTVNSLFNDGLAALQALGTQWQSLSAVGIDTIWIQQQFTRLLGGLLDTVQQVLSEAFTGGDFGEFLAVLGSIPEAVTNLNPVWAQLRQLGVVFAQVVGPIVQVVGTLEDELRTTAERVTFTADRISELRGALVDAGSAADRALPLYAQLAQALQANAAALIQNIHEQAEAMRTTATARIEGQRGRIEQEVTRVEDFWQTWADGERAALDARVEAEQEALDVRVQAEREALDARMDAEREVLSAGIDAHRKRIEDEVTRVTDFWNTWGDAQRAALDAWVESSTKMINTWAESTTTTANQLKRVNEAILAEQSPAKQRAALEAQKAGLINLINATGSQAAITELIDVDQQLLALAKQSNNLAGIQASIDELAAIQSSLTVSLASQTGQTDPFMATQVVQQVQADYLAAISAYQQTQTDRIQQTLDDNLGALQVVAQAQYDYLSTQEAIALETIATNQEAQSDAITASQKMQSDAITANQEAQTARIEQTLKDNLSALQIVAQAQYDYLAVQQANTLRDIAAWEEANVKAVKEDLITQLRVLELALQNLFAGQQIVQSLLHSPIPVTIMGQSGVQAAGGVGVPAAGGQRGGIIGLASGQYYAQGGMVPGRFEPGERVYFPPIPAGVAALNRDVPRFSRGGGFTVPGSGVGDSFTALVPNGSFALNKRASGGMGFQGGGMVHGGSSTGVHSITVNIDMRGSQVRGESDYRRLTSEFRAAVTEALKEIERRSPKRGR